MKKLLMTLGALMFWSSSAYAVCTKPVGKFVGSAAGEIYNPQTKATVKFALTQTITIAAGGNGNFTQSGEATIGPLNVNVNFAAADNVFNANTCVGRLKANGRLYQYTSSVSGNDMTLVDITPFPDANVSVYVINLKKV